VVIVIPCVDINEDGSITVEDNGRYCDSGRIHKKVSALEVVMTKVVLEESLIKILIKFLVDSTCGVSVVNALKSPGYCS
jgi:DNA gyrase/topoisomerase IV subunit B